MTQISTSRIIKNDYAAFLLTIAGPILLLIATFVAVFGSLPSVRNRGGQEIDPAFVYITCVIAACLAILFLFLLMKRIATIKRVVTHGPRVTATILGVSFFKDRGRVDYRYSYEGADYQSGSAIMKNRETETLADGGELIIAVDPEKPCRAMVPSLFGAA